MERTIMKPMQHCFFMILFLGKHYPLEKENGER